MHVHDTTTTHHIVSQDNASLIYESVLDELTVNRRNFDVELRASDFVQLGRQKAAAYFSHSQVIALSSPLMRTILTDSKLERLTSGTSSVLVLLPDHDPQTLASVVTMLYGGFVHANVDQCHGVLDLLRLLGVETNYRDPHTGEIHTSISYFTIEDTAQCKTDHVPGAHTGDQPMILNRRASDSSLPSLDGSEWDSPFPDDDDDNEDYSDTDSSTLKQKAADGNDEAKPGENENGAKESTKTSTAKARKRRKLSNGGAAVTKNGNCTAVKDQSSADSAAAASRGGKPFTCVFCVATRGTKRDMVRHLKSAHNVTDDDPRRVDRQVFHSGNNWKYERKLLIVKEPIASTPLHQCPHCAAYFITEKGLGRHRAAEHLELELTCQACNIKFKTIKLCTDHKNKVHVKKFQCQHNDCEYVALNRRTLAIHVRTHTGEKPFVCHICSRAFALKLNMTRHLVKHSGEKPYTCSSCDYAATNAALLFAHKRIHQEKHIRCDKCDYRCINKQNLRRHMWIHAPNMAPKPYKCSWCPYAAIQKTNLLYHERSKHLLEKYGQRNLDV